MSEMCKNHPAAEAKWRCGQCGSMFCHECLAVSAIGRRTRGCPDCGGACTRPEGGETPPIPANGEAAAFFKLLPQTLTYPVRGFGPYIILGGALLFYMLGWLRCLPIAGMLGSGIAGICKTAYMFHLVGTSAAGETDPPNWPEFSELWGLIVEPAARLLAVLFVSFLPLIVYWVAVTFFDVRGSVAPFWALVVLGVLYAPMGLIAVSLYDSVNGLNPLIVVPAIVRTAPAYVVACGVLLGAMYLGGQAATEAEQLVPVIGPLIGWAITLYSLMLEMRVLGLIYRTHERKLGWFD